jgi:preprotein translocase subunit YajC
MMTDTFAILLCALVAAVFLLMTVVDIRRQRAQMKALNRRLAAMDFEMRNHSAPKLRVLQGGKK